MIEILSGSPAERQRGNDGLRVPIFTTTGNHDWRTFPCSPAFRRDIFGITKKCAEELDFWYRNTSVEIGKKLEQVQQKLISKGSPLLARSWWGAITSMGYRGVVAGWQRLWQRASAVIVKYGRQLLWALAVGLVGIDSGPNLTPDGLLAWSKTLWQGLRHLSWHVVGQHALLFAGLGCLLLALIATFVIPSFLYTWLRGTLEGLIAIEAEVSTISEYFLRVNPYFNYAFQLENLLRWQRFPHWLVLVAGVRLTEIFSDWTYLLLCSNITWFGRAALFVSPPANLAFGWILLRTWARVANAPEPR